MAQPRLKLLSISLALLVAACGTNSDNGNISAISVQTGGSSPVAAITKEQLGKRLFADTTLSNPPGMACISCHDPSAGFTFPNSQLNMQYGTAPGAVTGRFGNRKSPTVS